MRVSAIAISVLLLMVLIISFQPYQIVRAQTAVPLESKTLNYVENVLPFDMSHYNITVSSSYSLPSGPNDPTITQAVVLDLKSSDSSIHVVCVYVNGVLHQCGVRPSGAPPVSDRNYASVKDVAARVLQAHQEQTGLDSTGLLNMLSLVNDTEITNVKLGDVSLGVSHFPDIIGFQTVNGIPVPVASNSSFSVTFDWTCTQNGIPYCQVALTFDKGILYNLQDERAMQPVAGTNISISKDPTTPSPAPVAAAQQGNITSLPATSQPTNGISAQTNQLSSKSSQKSADSQVELVIPLLIAAVVAYVIVVIVVLTYKSNLNVSKKTEN